MNHLVPAARFELAERLRLYPDAVRAGRIEPLAASIDAEAWSVIADWLAGQRPLYRRLWCSDSDTDFDIGPAELRDALARARESRAAACARHPENDDLAARMGRVEIIAERVAHVLDFTDGLNAELRDRARQAQAA